MIGILITAHGNYASGCISGYNLVTGGSDNISVLDFEGDQLEDYKKQLKYLIKNMVDKYKKLVILTDIAGGTPYNTSVELSNGNPNIAILSGTNFHLIYELANSNQDFDKIISDAIKIARDGIDIYQQVDDNEDRSFEGGI